MYFSSPQKKFRYEFDRKLAALFRRPPPAEDGAGAATGAAVNGHGGLIGGQHVPLTVSQGKNMRVCFQ